MKEMNNLQEKMNISTPKIETFHSLALLEEREGEGVRLEKGAQGLGGKSKIMISS